MVAATACSATTVLPDPVGALTSTERPASMAAMASSWKRSRVKPRSSASLTAPRLGPGRGASPAAGRGPDGSGVDVGVGPGALGPGLLAAPQLEQQGADADGHAVEQDHGH